jgi:hypothetical protein
VGMNLSDSLMGWELLHYLGNYQLLKEDPCECASVATTILLLLLRRETSSDSSKILMGLHIYIYIYIYMSFTTLKA